MKHLNIRVSGKVQGVFFRASARDVARSLGLNGFVRNEPDGSVYIEAEGRDRELSQFEDWCKKGPPHAQVSGVQIEEGMVQNFQYFNINR